MGWCGVLVMLAIMLSGRRQLMVSGFVIRSGVVAAFLSRTHFSLFFFLSADRNCLAVGEV
eukprot:8822726-Pyramimonas_sp.AAC.1